MKLFKIGNYFFIFLLLAIRPFLGPSACRYSVGCTEFAISQWREHSFFKACFIIAKRVLACNPFNAAQ